MPGMDLGIDLGTSQVVITAAGRGILLREPAVLAVDEASGRLIACGREAYAMQGRAPASIQVIRPMAKGVISDYDIAERMLKYMVGKICAYKVLKPRAAVSVPAAVTEVEQRSVVEAVTAANVRRVILMEEAVAAAIGAGLDVAAARGCMAADLGAGTVDVAVMTLRGVASSISAKVGGDDMDDAIIRYMRNKYKHVIGILTAEQVKKTIGCALPIVLTGGLSQMSGMADLIAKRTGVACRVAENPEDCVAKGLGKAMKYADVMRSGVYDISQFSYRLADPA